MSQAAIELFISSSNRWVIVRGALQRCGNVCTVRSFKEDWDELCVQGACIIHILVDERAFPQNSMACAWLFFTHDTAIVRWRADYEHEICLLNLVIHPAWPAFGR